MSLAKEVFLAVLAAPDGVTFPQVQARLLAFHGRGEVQAVLTRMEREGWIKVERTDVSALYLAPGPRPVIWGAL
jgi:hypothetical protein